MYKDVTCDNINIQERGMELYRSKVLCGIEFKLVLIQTRLL